MFGIGMAGASPEAVALFGVLAAWFAIVLMACAPFGVLAILRDDERGL